MKRLLYLHIVLIILISSCSKDQEPNLSQVPEKFKVSEKTTSQGIIVTLWSDHDLLVAYNKLYVTVKNSAGVNITDAVVTYSPVMDMNTMKHSSPVEQPSYIAEKGYYEGAVVFSMPAGEMGRWTLTVTVNNEVLSFDISPKTALTNTKYTGTFVGTDGISYSISLVQPVTPKIGLNDLEILINQRQNLMAFPPVEDLTVEVTPEMPSMSHGSPNNVNPVHKNHGHYVGKVNFTMTGHWRLHLSLKKGNTVIIEDATLDLVF